LQNPCCGTIGDQLLLVIPEVPYVT
jgi:hypothetical protein